MSQHQQHPGYSDDLALVAVDTDADVACLKVLASRAAEFCLLSEDVFTFGCELASTRETLPCPRRFPRNTRV